MDIIPIKKYKTITNIDELKDAVELKENINTYQLRSDFVVNQLPSITFDTDNRQLIFDDLKYKIQSMCKNLPHDRIILSIRLINETVEITINPLTCTA